MEISHATACFSWSLPSPHAKTKLHNLTHSSDKADSLFRAYSSCFMLAIVAHMRLPFFKMFSNFVHFAQIFKYFVLFCPFSEKLHTCPYVLHHKVHKSSCDTLFLKYLLQKYYQLFILGTYDIFGHFHQKRNPNCRNFDAYQHAKMNSIPNF